MITKIFLFAGFAGITVFIGGILANLFGHHIKDKPVKEEITHTMMAFGGGIILSAIALVLVPRGMEKLDLLPLSISFLGGAVAFFFLDRYLSSKTGKIGTLLAMLMDFIPESIILGSVFTMDSKTAILLAVFIGIQNLPEAFNAFRDLVISGFKTKTTLLIFFFLSFSGIAGAFLGYFFLTGTPTLTAHLMIAASGGLLYLIFQDVAPESKLHGKWFPSLGATLGFLLGMISEKVL